MTKAIKYAVIFSMVGLASGCASTSDLDGLQSQIDTLKSQVSSASSDAASARADAAEAASKAAAAEAAANRAAQYAQETNDKLDRMFKKSMMK